MNLKKAPPGKLDALKAMMGGGAPEEPMPPQGEGDVMGPEAAPEGEAMSPAPEDIDGQMNGVLDSLTSASAVLEGVQPPDERDASAIAQAREHLAQALELINSCAHPEGGDQEPTAEEQGGEMNQKDGEL